MYTPLLDQPSSPSLGWFTTVNLVPRDSTGATSRCDIDKAEFYGETPLQARKKQVHLRRVFSVWYWWEFDGFLKIRAKLRGILKATLCLSNASLQALLRARWRAARVMLRLCSCCVQPEQIWKRKMMMVKPVWWQPAMLVTLALCATQGLGKRVVIGMRASRFPFRRRPLLVNTFSINYVTLCYYVSRLYFKNHATSTANFPCRCPQARVLLEQGADPRHAEAQRSTSMGLTGCSHAGEGSVPWCLGDIRDGLPPRWDRAVGHDKSSSCLVLQRLLPSETLDFRAWIW